MDEKLLLSEIQSQITEEGEENLEEIESTSKKIFKVALDSFQNKQYKKTLQFIKMMKLDDKATYYWQISFLKLSCYQEIIERRLNLYYYNSNKISSIEKYLTLFNQNLNEFIMETNNNPKDKLFSSKYEIIITFILRQINNYSRFCIYQNFLFDCIGFLGLGERLIKKTSDFIYSPDAFHYACDIYVFLSSLYIISDNFDTAKRYIMLCLKLSYKELELRLQNNDYFQSLINLNDIHEKEREKIESLFLNITVCFFHLGICNENEYDFDSAYEAYKQAKWFISVFPNDKMIEFLSTIYNMEKRELLRNKLIEFFKKESQNIFDKPKNVLSKKPKEIYDEEENKTKFKRLENYLEKLKIKEIDDDEPDLLNKVKGKPFSNKVGTATKTIHVLNYLMKDKFNEVIDKMKKIELHNLNNQTKQIIQKQIIRIKNDEREKENKEDEKNNQKNENNNIYKNKIIIEEKNNNKRPILYKIPEELEEKNLLKTKLFNNNRTFSKYKLSKTQNNLNYSSESSNYSSKIFIKKNCTTYNDNSQDLNNSNYSKKLNTSIQITSRNKTLNSNFKNYLKNSQNVEKIIYDSYIFNKKFLQKRNFLENQYSKELKFQKTLLYSKIVPKENGGEEKINIKKIQNKCEDFFKNTLNTQILLAKEREILQEKQRLKEKSKNIRVFHRIPTFLKKQSDAIANKKNISPEIENLKIYDQLTSQIEDIDNLKYFLLSSFKRNLKKSKSNRK